MEVRLGQARRLEIFADGVEVGGERLHSYNVIWAAGVRAAPLVETLGVRSRGRAARVFPV